MTKAETDKSKFIWKPGDVVITKPPKKKQSPDPKKTKPKGPKKKDE